MIFTFSKALILHEMGYKVCDKDGLTLSLYTNNGVHFYYDCGNSEYALYNYIDKFYLTPESQAKYEKSMSDFEEVLNDLIHDSAIGAPTDALEERVITLAQALPPTPEEEI